MKATLRRAWPVLVAYGVFSIWGMMCFVTALVLTSGGFGVSAGSLAPLAGVLVATAVGHVLGNFLGLARLRMAVVLVLFGVLTVGALLSGAVIGPLALFAIVAVFATLGGYLGIASRLDVVASWFPLSFSVGGAIIWVNGHGGVATFNGGSKHQIWDLFTLACLSGGVFLMLVFLATRNSLGLTVWQEVARPAAPGGDPGEGVAVARPGRGSLLVLMVFTVAVLGATALISPYLFRTRADKDGKDGKTDQQQQGEQKQRPQQGHGQGQGQQGSDQGPEQEGERHRMKHRRGRGHPEEQPQQQQGQPLDPPPDNNAGQAATEALAIAAKVFGWLLVVALILLFLYLAVFPPIRRAFLLRHLEKPLWPVSPTSRVMNLWRRALSSLAVVEIEPLAGESPRDFARRARADLARTLQCDAPGLEEAAAIVEKIDYAGRGLGAGDEQTMRDAIAAFLRALDPHIGFGKKLGSSWGRAPEVES